MTVALCVTVIIGTVFGGFFLLAGAHPFYAIGGFLLPCSIFAVFFFPTLSHAADHPDAAVTSEECYARVVEARAAAKDMSIVRPEDLPLMGGSRLAIASATSPPKTEAADA